MKKFFKTCHVYRRPDGFFFAGQMNTSFGGIAVPPVAVLALTASPSRVGELVLRIFDGLPDHLTEVNLATARQPYIDNLKALGFKSPSTFEKQALLIAIQFDGALYEVLKHEKDERGAFVVKDSTKLPMATPAEQLGQTILTRFPA